MVLELATNIFVTFDRHGENWMSRNHAANLWWPFFGVEMGFED